VQELLFMTARQSHVMADISSREVVILAVMALPVIAIGVHPAPLLDILRAPVAVLTTGAMP
jgi:NADH-quinone oxidoreductase subunit M